MARFQIHSLEDVSHAIAKRYKAVLLVNQDCSREDLRKVILKATKQIRRSNHYRNQQSADCWKKQPAHVVWLFVAADLEDVEVANWLCRAEWISPEINSASKLVPMRGDEQIGDIQICWNDDYEVM